VQAENSDKSIGEQKGAAVIKVSNLEADSSGMPSPNSKIHMRAAQEIQLVSPDNKSRQNTGLQT